MIEYDFAKDVLEEIEFELNRYEEEEGISKKTDDKRIITSNYRKLYKNQNFCLPIFARQNH